MTARLYFNACRCCGLPRRRRDDRPVYRNLPPSVLAAILENV